MPIDVIVKMVNLVILSLVNATAHQAGGEDAVTKNVNQERTVPSANNRACVPMVQHAIMLAELAPAQPAGEEPSAINHALMATLA